jgi:hypothetical protein
LAEAVRKAFAKIGGIAARLKGANISGRVADVLPTFVAYCGERTRAEPHEIRAKPIGQVVAAFATRSRIIGNFVLAKARALQQINRHLEKVCVESLVGLVL